jgi:hypothetical protein
VLGREELEQKKIKRSGLNKQHHSHASFTEERISDFLDEG